MLVFTKLEARFPQGLAFNMCNKNTSVYIYIQCIYPDLPKGAKWFLTGVNSPSLVFNWHPLEGAGTLQYHQIINLDKFRTYIYLQISAPRLIHRLVFKAFDSSQLPHRRLEESSQDETEVIQ